MMDDTPIYQIEVFEYPNKEELLSTGEPTGLPDRGMSQIVGFYYDYPTARDALEQNWADIHEAGAYNAAFITEVPPGLYPFSGARWYFKWDENEHGFRRVDEPEIFTHVWY